MKNKILGVTLIELMIVVAVVGILTAVAYPSYRGYVEAGERQTGRGFIKEIRDKQAIFYGEKRKYTNDFEKLKLHGSSTSTMRDDDYSYTLTLTNNSFGFRVVATPRSSSGDDKCGNMAFEMPGYKQTVSKEGADLSKCWGALIN